MWVRSEYAGELAVLSTWLTAFLPWSVSYISRSEGDLQFTVVNVRFVLFNIHYLFGIRIGQQRFRDLFQLFFQTPAYFPDNQTQESWLWVAAAVFFLAMLALSIAYYAREDWLIEHSPVDPVRLFGGAFAVLGTAFGVATVMFYPHQLTVPVGTLLMWVFAVMLLRVERT